MTDLGTVVDILARLEASEARLDRIDERIADLRDLVGDQVRGAIASLEAGNADEALAILRGLVVILAGGQ